MTEEITKTVSGKVSKAADAVLDPINQRLSNPLIGSFALSFILLNWQPIIFLFVSSKTIEDKFAYISGHFYGQSWDSWLSWCMYLVFPLFISVLYAICLPRLEDILEKINLTPRKNKMDRIHTLNVAEYDNRVTYAKKQSEIEHVKANYMEIEELNKRIEFLSNQVKDRSKHIDAITAENENNIKELKERLEHSFKDRTRLHEDRFEYSIKNRIYRKLLRSLDLPENDVYIESLISETIEEITDHEGLSLRDIDLQNIKRIHNEVRDEIRSL